MARSRNIKPGLFKNEILGTADPLYTLAFEGLWLLSDREGRLEDRPLRIKAETFPYRDQIDMEGILTWLQETGFILRFEASGRRYIQVVNFRKHQNPHKNETDSEIPSPDKFRISTELIGSIPDENGSARADCLSTDSGFPSTATSAGADPLPCHVGKIVEAYHRLMPDNPQCKVLNTSRRGAIKSRWHEAARLTCKPFGYSTVEDGLKAWEEFFETCAESTFLTGRATPQPGKPPFIADVDFLFSPKGFTGCIENKYHRETA